MSIEGDCWIVAQSLYGYIGILLPPDCDANFNHFLTNGALAAVTFTGPIISAVGLLNVTEHAELTELSNSAHKIIPVVAVNLEIVYKT